MFLKLIVTLCVIGMNSVLLYTTGVVAYVFELEIEVNIGDRYGSFGIFN